MSGLLIAAALILVAHRVWKRRQRRAAPSSGRGLRADRHTFEVTLDDKRRAEAEARGWRVMDGGGE